MAVFLIYTVNGENSQRYQRGDIIAAFDDAHVWGRRESRKVWTDEGNIAAYWPDIFLILELNNLSLAQARNYCIRTGTRRSDYNIDIDDILSRISQTKLDIYNAERRLTFNWNNPTVQTYIKSKL
jgi:hypothetical protein